MANQVKKRNPHACNPIMRKGGVHQKSNSAKRAKDKRQLKEQARAMSRDCSFGLQAA
ncbi:hypothetical protein [Hahella ganghwensis]|uniref:hypothetical protein n=1 Tax=Hahella ganghwensis TaxID=286420 RepID=UPI000361BA82|nr:hypothetical protein [Hahella ganghwensis]